MKYLILLTSIILLNLPLPVLAKDGLVSAAEGWNGNAGNQTSYDKLVKLSIAEAIERKQNGYYDQWQQSNLYITNYAIGQQLNIEADNLDGIAITNNQCGHTISQASNFGGASELETSDVTCTIGAANESAK
ncbi:hypothetical protein [Sneathiella sp.]|uniref:hypothetical protein n=1 Tax=Sneathiella sp. TaxID=1964365 RepID=UPI0035615584